jgi:hypothetical protein
VFDRKVFLFQCGIQLAVKRAMRLSQQIWQRVRQGFG